MAVNGTLGLGFLFTAKDLASGTMMRLSRSFTALDAQTAKTAKSFQVAIGTITAGVVSLAAGMGVIKGAIKAADFSGNFTQQLAAAGQIMQASTKDMAALREEIIATGINTKFSPDEIVEGAKNLGAAGLNAQEALKTIRPAALLATSGQIALDEASRAVVGTLNAFQLEATQAGIVSDKLARITQMTNFQAKDFEVGLSRASATASVYGQSFNEVLAVLGSLRDMNVEASVASTALREAIRRVSSDANVQKRILGAGVEIYDKSTGKIRDLHKIMVDLSGALEGASEKTRANTLNQVFGARGVLAYAAVMSAAKEVTIDGVTQTLKYGDAIQYLKDQVESATGTNERYNEALLNTYQGQKQIYSGITATLATVMGVGFESAFLPVLKIINSGLEKLTTLIDAIPAPVKTMIAQFVIASGVLLTIGGALTTIAGGLVLFKLFAAALAPILITAVAITGALAAGFTVVGAAIGTAVYGIKNNLGGLGDQFSTFLGKAKLFFSGLKQALFDGGIRGDTLAQLMEKENTALMAKIARTVQIIYRIKVFFEGMMTGIVDSFKKNEHVFSTLGAAFKDLGVTLGVVDNNIMNIGTHSNKSKEAGKAWGDTLAKALLLAVKGLTLTVYLLDSSIQFLKNANRYWNQFVGFLITTTALVIVGAGALLTYKGIVWGIEAATWAWAAARTAVFAFDKAAIFRFFTIALIKTISLATATWSWAAGMAATIAPMALAAGLAFLLGYAVGQALDHFLGISKAITDIIENTDSLRAFFGLITGVEYAEGFENLTPDQLKVMDPNSPEYKARKAAGANKQPRAAEPPPLASGVRTAPLGANTVPAARAGGGGQALTDTSNQLITPEAMEALSKLTNGKGGNDITNINLDSELFAQLVKNANSKQSMEVFAGGGFSD